MDSAAARILKEIEAAFPARRPACFDPIVNSGVGEEPLLTAAEFADKEDWTQLSGAWLDQAPAGWASALHFLSDEAACFHIPAFLAADLRGELKRVEPVFHLTHGFDDMYRDLPIGHNRQDSLTDEKKRRWSHLTSQQALAIVHYLEWRIWRYGKDMAYAEAEALAAYWYGRAAPSAPGRDIGGEERHSGNL